MYMYSLETTCACIYRLNQLYVNMNFRELYMKLKEETKQNKTKCFLIDSTQLTRIGEENEEEKLY